MAQLKALKLFQFNAAGISSQKAEISDFLASHGVHIFAVCETYLKTSHDLVFPGFSTYRQDRPSRGGGVALFIKSTLQHSPVTLPSFSVLEAIGVEVSIQSTKVLFVSAYLKPTDKLDTQDLLAISNTNPHFCIMGDFNSKHPAWSPNSPANVSGRILFNLVTNSIQFNIYAPPSPTRPVSGSIIDFMVSSLSYPILSIETHDVFSSDHIPVLYLLAVSPDKAQFHPRLAAKDVNWPIFEASLSMNFSCSPLFPNRDSIDSAVSDLTANIKNAIHSSTRVKPPLHSVASKLPPYIRDLIAEKNRLRKRFALTCSPVVKADINRLQSQIKSEIFEFRNQKLADDISAH